LTPWSYREVWVVVANLAVRAVDVAIVVAVVGLVVEWAHHNTGATCAFSSQR
jgi:hypothetical protein